jgi:hypothetical protein
LRSIQSISEVKAPIARIAATTPMSRESISSGKLIVDSPFFENSWFKGEKLSHKLRGDPENRSPLSTGGKRR